MKAFLCNQTFLFRLCSMSPQGGDMDYQQPFISSCLSWQLIWWRGCKFRSCYKAVRPSAPIGFCNLDPPRPHFPLYPCKWAKMAAGKRHHLGGWNSTWNTTDGRFPPVVPLACDDPESKINFFFSSCLVNKHTCQEYSYQLNYFYIVCVKKSVHYVTSKRQVRHRACLKCVLFFYPFISVD